MNAAVDDEFLRIELRGLEPVPDSDRRGHPRELYFIWAGALADFFSILAGALLVSVLGLGVVDAVAVLVLGALAGGALLGPLSVTGVRAGVPQIVFSRLAFGRRGAVVGGVLTSLIAIGWFSYDCAIAVTTAKALPVFGSGPPPWAVALMLLAMVVGCVLVAVFGHRTITVVQTVQAPAFMVLALLVGIVLAPRFHPGLASTLDPASHVSAVLLGFTATFALIVSWATYAADYSRYLPRKSSGLAVSLWSGAGSVTTLVLCGILGVLVQSIDPKDQDLAGLIVGHLPAWLAWAFVAFIVIAEMSSNYLNVYTAALSSLASGLTLLRWQAAVAVGLVGGAIAGLVLANTDRFASIYLSFLTVTYVWFPAWCVVVLADYWQRRRAIDPGVFLAGGNLPAWRWPALATFGVGTLATLLFFQEPGFFRGVGAQLLFHDQFADISPFIGVAVSVVVFLGLVRLLRPRSAPA
ncbi:MAG: nucleobase:cation symporter, family [Chloroflexota bacterium]|jgi:NCS1 family nucleobase:cation symporter-1|nr:nucleobase:cation symporter, family [Chloroflexota bacterium]